MSECLAALKSDGTCMNKIVELEEEEEEDYEDDGKDEEVFSLELERGELGLGLALVDTRVSDRDKRSIINWKTLFHCLSIGTPDILLDALTSRSRKHHSGSKASSSGRWSQTPLQAAVRCWRQETESWL